MLPNSNKHLKTMIDRPWSRQESYKIMNRMVTELSPYTNPIELDSLIEFMWVCEQGEFDTNMSVSDCEVQLRLILGSERYAVILEKWKQDNKRLVTLYGTLKYKCKKTSIIYDGLDPDDLESDYEKVYV